MSELEEKLNGILSDPKMMEQISAMASMLSAGQEQKMEPEKQDRNEPSVSAPVSIPPNLLKALSGFSGKQGIDPNQQHLLQALQPYLSRDRIGKLERAMGAARMANAASAFLDAGGLKLLISR